MLSPSLTKNDRLANIIIPAFSIIVFIVVVFLENFRIKIQLPFNIHYFALFNAINNSIVAVLLIVALFAVKNKKYELHKSLMLIALVLSLLFLVSYIIHRLFSPETKFGDSNHDGLLSKDEYDAVSNVRLAYFMLLATHIFFAATVLPFVLYTAYRALTSDFEKHKKIAKLTWPVWFYVALTGPIVYYFISPYYY